VLGRARGHNRAVADVIGTPPRRPPLRWTPFLLPVALVALVGYALVGGQGTPAPLDADDGGPPIVAPPEEPWLAARPGIGPIGLRLLLDGRTPRLVDAGTGHQSSVPGLRLADGTYVQLLSLGGTTVGVSEQYGRGGGLYLLRPGEEPLLLGVDGAVSPARTGELVVAAHRADGTTISGFTMDRRLRWQWRVPGVATVLGDTAYGLVLTRPIDPQGRAGGLLLVDRRTGAVRRFMGPAEAGVAAGERAVAWLPGRCVPRCPLMVTDLATGAIRRYDLPYDRVPSGGAFSPDGTRIALRFSAVPTASTHSSLRGFVAVLDFESGYLEYVTGLRSPVGRDVEVAWSPDGQWLALDVKWVDRQRIALWRDGEDLVVLPTVIPGDPGQAALAAAP
jgi:WD40-like Beta Propeller Repeat